MFDKDQSRDTDTNLSQKFDEEVIQYFQPEKLEAAYKDYRESKRDFFEEDLIKIPMGTDGITHDTFEDSKKQVLIVVIAYFLVKYKLYKLTYCFLTVHSLDKELKIRAKLLSNRLIKGTYLFSPFREVKIPKIGGGFRTLSIATVRDVIVQKVLYNAIYNKIEQDFNAYYRLDKVSYAYRKGKSAPAAAKSIHQYIKQGFTCVLDADIVKFFDKIPHSKLLEIIENKFGKDTLVTNLLRRFIKTDRVCQVEKKDRKDKLTYQDNHGNEIKLEDFKRKKGKRTKREEGIPQGGILSGLLANLYLHSFDRWVLEHLAKQYSLRYVRYADDFVILCQDFNHLDEIKDKVSQYLQEKLKLDLHSDKAKTKKIEINGGKNQSLEFIGYEFTETAIRIKSANLEKFKEKISQKIKNEPSYGNKNKRFSRIKRFPFFIEKIINRKIQGRGEEICQKCGKVRPERSWLNFYSVITDVEQLRQLDKWIRQQISLHFFKTYQVRLKRKDFKQVPLASLEQEYYRLNKRSKQNKQNICSCR